jgi:hypothetical protein
LKTKHGGILLIAVGRDANDQYFPSVFGAVENECKDSWRWFLTLLLEDIESEKNGFLFQISKRYITIFLSFIMFMYVFFFC